MELAASNTGRGFFCTARPPTHGERNRRASGGSTPRRPAGDIDPSRAVDTEDRDAFEPRSSFAHGGGRIDRCASAHRIQCPYIQRTGWVVRPRVLSTQVLMSLPGGLG